MGIRGRDGVLLAGEAQVSTDAEHWLIREPKVASLSETVAVAIHGSGRVGQIVCHHLADVRGPALGQDELSWALNDLIPHLRDRAAQHGTLRIENGVESLPDESGFLLAVRNRLFDVNEELCVDEHEQPYDAAGSGASHAFSALHALIGSEPLTPARQLRAATKAIRTAQEFGNFVGGKITSVRTVTYTIAELALARRMLRGR